MILLTTWLGQSHWCKDKDSQPDLLVVECWKLPLRHRWHKDEVSEAALRALHSHAAGRPAPRFRSPDLQELPITSARLTGSPKPSSASHCLRPMIEDMKAAEGCRFSMYRQLRQLGTRFVVRSGRISKLPAPCTVAAGILPAVELGVSPGGMDVRVVIVLEGSNAGPGGKLPPSTAGRMPAATSNRPPPPCPLLHCMEERELRRG